MSSSIIRPIGLRQQWFLAALGQYRQHRPQMAPTIFALTVLTVFS
jgi:hypothetical protein